MVYDRVREFRLLLCLLPYFLLHTCPCPSLPFSSTIPSSPDSSLRTLASLSLSACESVPPSLALRSRFFCLSFVTRSILWRMYTGDCNEAKDDRLTAWHDRRYHVPNIPLLSGSPYTGLSPWINFPEQCVRSWPTIGPSSDVTGQPALWGGIGEKQVRWDMLRFIKLLRKRNYRSIIIFAQRIIS